MHVGAWRSEGPHACAKGRGSVGWCDSYVQIVSNLEALRLQCHGVVCALPAGYSVADVFQPERGGGERRMFQYTVHRNSLDQLTCVLLYESNQYVVV